MAVLSLLNSDHQSSDDELLPCLQSITKALADFHSGNTSVSDLRRIVSDCITRFKDNVRYQNDTRFLKIRIIYLFTCEDFDGATREMDENISVSNQSLLYEMCALLLEAKGKLREADKVYQVGISRNAEPVARLKKAQAAFLDRMNLLAVAAASLPETSDSEMKMSSYINPWSSSIMKDLLQKINARLKKYDGYYSSAKAYPGKAPLSSLRNSSRNKIIEIGGKKYQIKGCAGQGGFALVFKAYVNSNPDEVVALKIQKPAFPWEFHMYRQLDLRILELDRSSFGFAHRMHVYADYSILVCDYLSNGTLQDAINSYLVMRKSMEEVLCMYYTIEMLHMLENLHAVGIIHGDFKADNLLIRYSSDELSEHDFRDTAGSWHKQGLCLVDWGRGIDLHLFPENVEFTGDSRTSCYRCVEMQENKPWKYQVDLYGLCVVAHMMLHGSYMEIERTSSASGNYEYKPKSSLKRYWHVELWKRLFTDLLNVDPGKYDISMLRNLRNLFEDHIESNRQLVKKLKELLAKQRLSLCSA